MIRAIIIALLLFSHTVFAVEKNTKLEMKTREMLSSCEFSLNFFPTSDLIMLAKQFDFVETAMPNAIQERAPHLYENFIYDINKILLAYTQNQDVAAAELTIQDLQAKLTQVIVGSKQPLNARNSEQSARAKAARETSRFFPDEDWTTLGPAIQQQQATQQPMNKYPADPYPTSEWPWNPQP